MFQAGVSNIASFHKDASDRNRTSPFAYTGSKFEFRSVGSKDSIAKPNTVLNTIAAEAFKEAADRLEKATDFEKECRALIKEYALAHSKVVFNGNNYDPAWVQEAKKRNLPIINDMVQAIGALQTDEAANLFEKFGIYTRKELESRTEIKYDMYAKAIHIEAKTMEDMAGRMYIPAVIKAIGEMAWSAEKVKKAIGDEPVVQAKLIRKASASLKVAEEALEYLRKTLGESEKIADAKQRAIAYRDNVKAAMRALRTPIDELETMIDKSIWPVPTYAELMFEV